MQQHNCSEHNSTMAGAEPLVGPIHMPTQTVSLKHVSHLSGVSSLKRTIPRKCLNFC